MTVVRQVISFKKTVLTGEAEGSSRVLEILCIDLDLELLLYAFRNIHCTVKLCAFVTYASIKKKRSMIQ